jgi:hypothetical protein
MGENVKMLLNVKMKNASMVFEMNDEFSRKTKNWQRPCQKEQGHPPTVSSASPILHN